MSNWSRHYANRVNSTYQNYFEVRYKSILDKILLLEPSLILEEGVGIGSISKFLLKNNIQCEGYDFDAKMLQLVNKNVPNAKFWLDNIHKPFTHIGKYDLVITHGVLEHFQDNEIENIFERYKKYEIPSIHYVPLDKYTTPSYGDERLLPYGYWLEMSGAEEYELFNNGHDLWFLIK